MSQSGIVLQNSRTGPGTKQRGSHSQTIQDMTTSASLENVVECVQKIYPPYFLSILKSALCEQHILVGDKQSVMREGHTGRQHTL